MQDELKHIFKEFFSDDKNVVHFLGDAERVTYYINSFGKMVPFDHPDAYAILEDEVILFEHFEFDSSKKSKKKGSQQHRSVAADDKAFSEIIPTENVVTHHGSIEADYSIENYRENITQVFEEHYNKIPSYIETLRKEGVAPRNTRITTMFFIEDTTLLGNMFELNSWDKPLHPIVLP